MKPQKIYEHVGCLDELRQYYKNKWKCSFDEDVPLTLVAITTDMLEATGEDEFKDYPIVPEIGVINKECHPSISKDGYEEFEGDVADLYDVYAYCGFVYALSDFLQLDKTNKNIQGTLTIDKAALHSYECRFTHEIKYYPVFKEHEDAQVFLQQLIEAYGDTFMSMIGFFLDKPVNLAGETGWKTMKISI